MNKFLEFLYRKIFGDDIVLKEPCRKHYFGKEEVKNCPVCGWSVKFTKDK